MIKSMKNKINIAFIAIVMLMTALMSCKTYAAELSETYQNGKMVKHDSQGNITSEISDYVEDEVLTSAEKMSIKISYDRFLADRFLFCSSHGISIPSGADTLRIINPKTNTFKSEISLKYPGEKGKITLSNNEVIYEYLDENGNTVYEKEDISEKIELKENEIIGEKYIDDTFTKKDIAYYATVIDKVCTPKAAYILNQTADNNAVANASNIVDDSNYVQLAWWQTEEGQEEGNAYDYNGDSKVTQEQKDKANNLYNTATAYEDFVKRIAEDVDDVDTYQTLSHIYPNGEMALIRFPKLKEDEINSAVKFNESDEIKVSFDKKSQTYLVGPLSIDYIESSTQFSNESAVEDVKFGSIENFNIYTDATGNEPLARGEYWDFVYTEARQEDDTSIYPHANEKFYIRLNYINGVTKLTKIDAEYKFLIAGAQYQVLTGNYTQYDWSIKKTVKNGKTTYELTSDSKDNKDADNKDSKYLTKESQTLSLVNKYARWYETMTVSADFSDVEKKEGKLKFYKKAVDENGNELTAEQIRKLFGKDQYFDLKVTLSHEGGKKETDIVRVKAGGAPVVKTYTWNTNANPYYQVEEMPTNNEQWKVKSITGGHIGDGSGYLEKSTVPVEIIATNEIVKPHENKIELYKVLSHPASKNQTFYFDVIITMPNGEQKHEEASILVREGETKGEKPWESATYKWYGKKAPTFEIEEKKTADSEGYEATIYPRKGSFGKSIKPIEVNAINKLKEKRQNSIELNKEISHPATEDETFEFDITITMNGGKGEKVPEKAIITVPKGETKGEKPWVSNVYTWSENEEAPIYEIVEIENEFSKKYKPVIDKPKGSLDDEANTIEVNALNKLCQNKIELYKTLSQPALADETFEFDVIITMNGGKGEKVVEKAAITVRKGQIKAEQPWVSNVYTWSEDEAAPIFEVKEIKTKTSEKYNAIIRPEKGNFDDYIEPIVVDALNKVIGERKNNIELNKKISHPALVDETFEFDVTITMNGGKGEKVHEKAKITVPKGETTGEKIWVSKEYTWLEDEEAPIYEIVECENKFSKKYRPVIDKPKGSLADKIGPIEVNVINEIYKNKIELNKEISHPASEDETFEFDVTITMNGGKGEKIPKRATIEVKKGETKGEKTWVSDVYTWSEDEEAPIYEIVERENEFSKKYTPVIDKPKGSLDDSSVEIKVNALNELKEQKSFLTIEKVLEEGQITKDTFDFRVTVDGVKNAENGKVTFDVLDVKPGEKKGPYEFVWQTNEAPKFTVEEINIDSKECDVKKITAETDDGTSVGRQDGNAVYGQLVADGNANVKVQFTNDMTKHSGGVKVIKEITTSEKITKETIEQDGKVKFDITVTVDGSFVYDGKTFDNEKLTITRTLPDNGSWEFSIDNIVWYGSQAPTFTVVENIPESVRKQGWKCKSVIYTDAGESITESEGYSLIDGKTIDVNVLNELPSDMEIDLTFSMGGIAWIDNTIDEKNNANDGYYSKPNGVYDEKYDTLKDNVEVTVYKVIYDASGNQVSREVATAYKDEDKNEVEFPIITKADGKWNVPRIPVPAVSKEQQELGYTSDYDIEFGYDGQNYEPTEFLSYQISSNGEMTKNTGSNAERADAYKSATTSGKDKYAKDSMAIETSNNNSLIAEISGKTEIDSNGDTTGIATLTDGSQILLNYHSDNAGDGYPTISKVQTADEDGRTLDIFKAAATTSAGNLTYPFTGDTDGTSLTNIDQYVDENGVHRKYKFTAVYNHCLNINLGLKQRSTVDVGLTKKLDNAKVVVKEKLYQYNYSGFYDLTEEKVNSLDTNVKVDNEVANVEYTLGLYKSDYYYRAEMYKNSADTSVYDALESFYKRAERKVTDTEMDVYLTYKIKMKNNDSAYDVKVNSIDDYYDSSFTLVRGNETKYIKTATVGNNVSDVNGPLIIADASDYSHNWNDVRTGIVGSDKDANGNNIVYNKMTATGLDIVLKPGESKEISVTFKLNKKDNADAKNAIILGQKCNVAEISSYSTYLSGTDTLAGKIDRDSAPGNVNISANNEKSWYEDDTFAAPRIRVNFVGNTQERTVDGLVWEDNSKDKNTENPEYNQQVGNGKLDSDEETIAGLKTELVEKIIIQNEDGTYTEYDYIWPTDQAIDALNGKSIKEVAGFTSQCATNENGKYVFGNVPAGTYTVRFTYGDNKIESKDYSEAKYYNGQDYKSTRFNSDLKNGSKVMADSYLDITKLNASYDTRNTALDNEVRRLEVVGKSREITYQNGSVLADYENDALYNEYYMYADTPKLDLNIELPTFGNDDYVYEVKNVSFGLEERPQTELTLDKQIEEMTLTTSDGRTIMSAKYDISYEVADNGEVTAKVLMDKENSYGIANLQELNRDQATNNGFRYINIDSSILEGTTLNVKYRFTVLNTGEVDRTGKLAEQDIDFANVCETLGKNLVTYKKVDNILVNNTTMGEYVGSIYYYGAAGDKSDRVVTTTVRQLVDYIDNDANFSGMMNSSANTSWTNITTAELKELINPAIIQNDIITDDKGVQYETENRNNLVVSVDSNDETSSLHNSGFVVELVPHAVSSDKSKASMNITISRYVGAEADDLQVENIAEIIKYNNTVGRKDWSSVPGNHNPANGVGAKDIMSANGTVSSGMTYEKDTSATEVITMSPPTGAGLTIWRLQLIGAITAGLAIIAVGIVVIKKKIIK